MNNILVPELVAHRGYSSAYPENSILAIEKALQAGACYVEFDVQLAADGVPVVVHDVNLQRTANLSKDITKISSHEAIACSAAYTEKFQSHFSQQRIPLLSDVIDIFQQWTDRIGFLEIKRGSLREFGVEFVVDKILPIIEPCKSRIVVISFDDEILRALKGRGIDRVGWVFEHWQSNTLEIAESIAPEFVFADFECVPDSIEQLPNHNWKWAVYEIDDARQAREWFDRGAQLVETNAIGDLLSHPLFSSSGCNERQSV